MVPAQLIIIMISVTNTGILLVEKHALFSDTHVDLSARGFHSDSKHFYIDYRLFTTHPTVATILRSSENFIYLVSNAASDDTP